MSKHMTEQEARNILHKNGHKVGVSTIRLIGKSGLRIWAAVDRLRNHTGTRFAIIRDTDSNSAS